MIVLRPRSAPAWAVAVAVLTTAACTRSGEDAIEVGAASPGGEQAPVGDDSPPTAAASGGTRAPGESRPTTQATVSPEEAIERGDFGTLDSVCGPAPEGQDLGETGSQGVTGDEVVVGTFADPGNQARPGLNQELFDSADVFTAWCNELGGINGRTITLNKHDSGLFNYQPKMAEACRSDFFLVGGGAVLDDAGQEDRLKCMLPDIPGFRATPQAIGADLMAAPTPAYLDAVGFGLGPQITAEFPDSIDNVGVLTGNFATTITQANIYRQAGEHFGWTFTYSDKYNPVGESSWVPYAQNIAQSGIRGLLYVGEPENLGLLVKALDQIGYELDWLIGTPNIYDARLVKTAGSALDSIPVFTLTGNVPFEYVDRSAALQEFQALFEKYEPDGNSNASLAINSFSAWLMFAEAAKECGAELTRRCVFENAQQLEESWDGGGLSTPAGGDCSVTLKATSEGFEVVEWKPNEGFFRCDPENRVPLREPIGRGTKLADVGKSMDDLT